MKKYFVVSDIHGFYDELIKTLNEKGFDYDNPDHILISLGDLFDRGSKPLELLKFVMALPKERRILIRGNHEDLLEDCCENEYFGDHDYHNGTDITVKMLAQDVYCNVNEYGLNPLEVGAMNIFSRCINHPLLVEYLNDCIDYYEIGDYIFVHSWVPLTAIGAFNPNWRNGNWEAARWGNPYALWRKKLVPHGKTIVFGHFHTSYGWAHIKNKCAEFGDDAIFDIFFEDGIIGLDACTVYSGQVNCFVFEA